MVERQSPPDMQQADGQPRIDLTASPTAGNPWNRKRDAHGKLKKHGGCPATALVARWHFCVRSSSLHSKPDLVALMDAMTLCRAALTLTRSSPDILMLCRFPGATI